MRKDGNYTSRLAQGKYVVLQVSAKLLIPLRPNRDVVALAIQQPLKYVK